MNNNNPVRLVSPSDVAKMSHRSRAAVSNWRANPALEFPDPVAGTHNRPLFSLDKVVTWLAARDIQVEKDTPEMGLWSLLNTTRSKVRIRDAAEAIVTVLAAAQIALVDRRARDAWEMLRTSHPDETGANFSCYAHTVQALNPDWRGLLELRLPRGNDAFLYEVVQQASYIPPDQHAQVADQLLQRLGASEGRTGGEHGAVNSRVSQLLVNAPTMQHPSQIYDPAMGMGVALLAAHERYPEARLTGEDINDEALTIACQRALLAGASLERSRRDVLLGDSGPSREADLILTEPPFGMRFDKSKLNPVDPRWAFGLPNPSTSELLWIQHVIYHLSQTGRGYVVTGRGPLFRTARLDQDVRCNLLRSGAVEAIIGLPPRMLPNTSIPLALWVLRRPTRNAHSVLLVDASKEAEPEALIGAWLGYLATTTPNGETAGMPAYARIPIDQLIADGANLQPERWVEAGQADPREVTTTIRNALALVRDPQIPPVGSNWSYTPSASRIANLKDLAAEGSITLHQGNVAPDTEREAGTQPWTLALVREQKKAATPLPPESSTANSSAAVRTRAGDVVVSTTGRVAAVVDTTGGRSVSRGLHIVRSLTPSLNPAYVAACLEGEWNTRFVVGATVQRVNLRDLEIPLISSDDQRRTVELLGEARRVRNQTEIIQAATESLTTGMLNAIRYDITLEDAK